MEDSLTLEKKFDQFFAGIEFKRVSSIVGLSPDFRNADYMHEGMKIIVELKILEKDYFKNGGVIDRFHQLIVIPERVDKNGFGVYRTTMPPPGKSTFEEPLGQLLKSANRQLKETKQHVFEGKGYGFVLLALNKFRSLSPGKTFDLICSTLEAKDFSSIDGFMLCTPTWDILIPDPTIQLHPPDCMVAIPDKTPEVMFKVLHRIAQLWCDRYSLERNIRISPKSYFYHPVGQPAFDP